MRKLMIIFIILCLSSLAVSCGQTTGSSSTTTTTSNTTTTTTCPENDIGNGNTIISGPDGPSGADYDSVFRALSVHPTDPDIVYMGTERNGFVKTTDGGTNWTRSRLGIRHDSLGGYPEIYDISIPTSESNILYTATVSSPGPITNAASGVYKSTNEGSTWFRRNCGLQNARITMINVDPNDPDIVIIGISGGYSTQSGMTNQFFNGGLFRSTNGGATWTQTTIEANDKYNDFSIIKRCKSDPNKLYTFGFSYDTTDLSLNLGFLKNTDNGQTWTQFGSALKNKWVNYFDISSNGTTIYASVPNDYKIYKSTNEGTSWSEFFTGTSGYAIAVSPSDPDRVLYTTVTAMHLSTDGLDTSIAVLENLSTTIDDIVFAPSDNSIVYAVRKGYIFYKSTNSGASFSLIKNIRDDVLNVIP